jgi:ribonucleoside-diphosphate reductase alpha chain
MSSVVGSSFREKITNSHLHDSKTPEKKLQVIRRNGSLTEFDATKIAVAITKAFLEEEGSNAALSSRVHEIVQGLTTKITDALLRYLHTTGTVHIEDIQDQVELALMRAEHHKVARSYILYREQRRKLRDSCNQQALDDPHFAAKLKIRVSNQHGDLEPLDVEALYVLVGKACYGLPNATVELVVAAAVKDLFDGVSYSDVIRTLIMSARMLIELEPSYSMVAARLLLHSTHIEVSGCLKEPMQELKHAYKTLFIKAMHHGVETNKLDASLRDFDLSALALQLQPERDLQFNYLGLQTLYDRYFLHHDGVRFELPQIFFMRIAMGLAMQEQDKQAKAIEFYNLLSSFDFMSSTPTLFNSATLRPQLSSCFLTMVPDDLHGIYDAIKDNALLSKYAGGLGNSWSNVRAMNAHIKGTNGKSQGVVPFLKVANDTAVAVNQGGKRKGAVCAYLVTWHLDIEEFLELRKNTGDDRRRTHDMNTANWIPDLFMRRVFENKAWTLFSPEDVPDLHDTFGATFDEAYCSYEAAAERGEIKNFKVVQAVNLWRKMLSMLFETGHPWITFRDPCNLRSPQQHVGVVHSSNLCTEITLNTSIEEIAVCNLGSVNLAQHVVQTATGYQLDLEKLQRTVTTAIRMLDNVIDINYYSVPQARTSNLRHRPIGLGLMGFQDALYKLDISYASEAALEFADRSMEAISYFAIQASMQLAKERGAYSSFAGSLWSKGILPIDSIASLKEYRGEYLQQDTSTTMDWAALREQVRKHGMRNSNVLAIAPTATIANICGVTQSIEPTYQNLFVKSNLSGEFTVINQYLVADLKQADLWDPVMVSDLKFFDGNLQKIDRIPEKIKNKYICAFELEPQWILKAASRRQKWIDQAQSLNLYMAKPSGKKIDELYRLAFMLGLKTTYYLRSLGASDAEKSTVERSKLNAVKACSIEDPSCEACQ